MKFIQDNWLLILVFVVLAIVVYKYWDKIKNAASQITTGMPPPTSSTIYTNSTGGSNTSNNNSNTGTNTGTDVTIKTSDFSFGDKLYAKANGVNVYKSNSISTSNLALNRTFSRDEFIGTFLGYDSNSIFLPKFYTKILIPNPAMSVYTQSSGIYSK